MTPTSTEAGPAETSKSRLFVLDGLRLVAALMVVSWHFVAGQASSAWEAETRQLFAPIWKLSGYGWLGVELFFLISGFVICMSSWGRTVGEFAISRITRLYPAYWVAVLLTTAVVSLLPIFKQPLPTVEVLVNLTMAQELLGVPHVDWSYWSLAVELQFYLLFAIVVARGVTYRRVVIFCVVWSLLAIIAAGFGNAYWSMIFASNHAPYFVAGVALFLIHRFGSTLLLWGIVAASWVLALLRIKSELWWNGAAYRPTAIIVTGFFALMAVVALGLLDRIRWRWLTTAGALTYPLYLLHQYIGLTVIKAVHEYLPAWVLLIGLLVALLVVSWLMHRLVERPIAALLRRHLRHSLAQMRNATARRQTPAQPQPADTDEPQHKQETVHAEPPPVRELVT